MYRLLVLPGLMVVFLLLTAREDTRAQVDISPTAQKVQIATATPLPTTGRSPTKIPPTFTPTDQGPPQLEPKPGNEVNGVNVRAEADIDSAVLGTIRTGERFIITGRFFRWLQFRYDPSPTGVGYVFDELVDIVGNSNAIPDLTQLQTSQDNTVLNATATADALQLTPGFEQTLTAESRIIEVPSGEIGLNSEDTTQDNMILPTFTFPPDLASPSTTGNTLPVVSNSDVGITDNSDGIAPIIPIVLLVSLGLIGLLLSLIRQ